METRERPEAGGSAEVGARGRAASPGRVLVVENTDDTAAVVQAVLSDEGYEAPADKSTQSP